MSTTGTLSSSSTSIGPSPYSLDATNSTRVSVLPITVASTLHVLDDEEASKVESVEASHVEEVASERPSSYSYFPAIAEVDPYARLADISKPTFGGVDPSADYHETPTNSPQQDEQEEEYEEVPDDADAAAAAAAAGEFVANSYQVDNGDEADEEGAEQHAPLTPPPKHESESQDYSEDTNEHFAADSRGEANSYLYSVFSSEAPELTFGTPSRQYGGNGTSSISHNVSSATPNHTTATNTNLGPMPVMNDFMRILTPTTSHQASRITSSFNTFAPYPNTTTTSSGTNYSPFTNRTSTLQGGNIAGGNSLLSQFSSNTAISYINPIFSSISGGTSPYNSTSTLNASSNPTNSTSPSLAASSSARLAPSVPNFSLIGGATSPRVDSIQTVALRLEAMQRNGRLKLIKQRAQDCTDGIAQLNENEDLAALASATNNTSQLTQQSMSVPSYYVNSQVQDDNKASLLSVDRYLRRRFILSKLDTDYIIRGRISNKSEEMGLTIDLVEIYPKPTVLTSLSGSASPSSPSHSASSNTNSISSTSASASSSSSSASILSLQEDELPSLSSLSESNKDDEFYTNNLEELIISCECHHGELFATTSSNHLNTHNSHKTSTASSQAHQANSSNAAALDRFRIGQYVKALVISVDIHSERIFLSMNQARLPSEASRLHKLGVIPTANTGMNTPPNPSSTSSSPTLGPVNPPSSYSLSFAPSLSLSASTSTKSKNVPRKKTLAFPMHPGSRSPSNTLNENTPKDGLQWLHEKQIFKNPKGLNIIMKAYRANPHGSTLPKQSVAFVDSYKELRALQNQAWARESVVKGVALANKGNFEGAMKCYKHALEIDPNYAQAYVSRGACYVLQHDLIRGIQEFEHALKLDPKHKHANNYLQGAKQKLARLNKSHHSTSSSTSQPDISTTSTSSSSSSNSTDNKKAPSSALSKAVPSSSQTSRVKEETSSATLQANLSTAKAEDTKKSQSSISQSDRETMKFVNAALKRLEKKKKAKEEKPESELPSIRSPPRSYGSSSSSDEESNPLKRQRQSPRPSVFESEPVSDDDWFMDRSASTNQNAKHDASHDSSSIVHDAPLKGVHNTGLLDY